MFCRSLPALKYNGPNDDSDDARAAFRSHFLGCWLWILVDLVEHDARFSDDLEKRMRMWATAYDEGRHVAVLQALLYDDMIHNDCAVHDLEAGDEMLREWGSMLDWH